MESPFFPLLLDSKRLCTFAENLEYMNNKVSNKTNVNHILMDAGHSNKSLSESINKTLFARGMPYKRMITIVNVKHILYVDNNQKSTLEIMHKVNNKL